MISRTFVAPVGSPSESKASTLANACVLVSLAFSLFRIAQP